MPIQSYWPYSTSVSLLGSYYLYIKGMESFLFCVVVSIIIFAILIWNLDLFLLWHHQIYHHQRVWNTKMKNTMNGFSNHFFKNGQGRRIRCIYKISWYGQSWFWNVIKEWTSDHTHHKIIINNIIISSNNKVTTQKQLKWWQRWDRYRNKNKKNHPVHR